MLLTSLPWHAAGYLYTRALHAAALAIGSNLGNRAANLTNALRLLQSRGNVQVGAVSCLYESAPAYVTEQPRFLNAAAVVLTRLEPQQLLQEIKQIEVSLGRDVVGGPRYGPRPVDLDIIFYDGVHQSYGNPDSQHFLQIPHPRWQERPFVTAPLSDLVDAPIAAWTSVQQPSSQGGWAFTAEREPSNEPDDDVIDSTSAADLVGSSQPMRELQAQLERAKHVWLQQQGIYATHEARY